MTKNKTLIGLILLLSSGEVFSQTNAELLARIEALEKKVAAYEKAERIESGERADLTPAKTARTVAASRIDSDIPDSSGELDDIDAAYLTNTNADNGWWNHTKLGGYGELHLNLGDKEVIDFHRWVLFLTHRFNDRVKLFTELELEHSLSGDGQPGEVELEQAYVEFALEQGWDVKVGQFLLPIGFLNEVHEPETFFGVERNNVEKNIIPTTWWEAGLAATKRFDNGLSFDVGFHSALSVSTDPASSNAYRIRSGRQKVAEADASEWAATARVKYSGIQGLDVTAFANYQSDISSDNAENNAALLLGGSLAYQNGGFGVKALLAHWDIDGASYAANGADSQWGYYVEPSYSWQLGGDRKIGVFGRYSRYSYARSVRNTRGGKFDEYTLGLNYWPVDNVVLKADYTLIDKDGGNDDETFNFGMGYSF